jgi:hypothetical protein
VWRYKGGKEPSNVVASANLTGQGARTMEPLMIQSPLLQPAATTTGCTASVGISRALNFHPPRLGVSLVRPSVASTQIHLAIAVLILCNLSLGALSVQQGGTCVGFNHLTVQGTRVLLASPAQHHHLSYKTQVIRPTQHSLLLTYTRLERVATTSCCAYPCRRLSAMVNLTHSCVRINCTRTHHQMSDSCRFEI